MITYQFAGSSQSSIFPTGELSSNICITGELSVPDNTPPDRVAVKVAHECARQSIAVGYLWDPFNLQILIKRKRKTRRRASHK